MNTSGQDTKNSEAENSDNENYPPSHSRGARSKSPIATGEGSNWRQPPLREVRLPHLYQPPEAEGCCIPPYKEPTEPWSGVGTEKEFMKFLKDFIPCSEGDCKNCETNTVHNTILKEGTFQADNIDDLEKCVHTILYSDDQEDIECKKIYNDALEQNKEMHVLHNKMETVLKLDR